MQFLFIGTFLASQFKFGSLLSMISFIQLMAFLLFISGATLQNQDREQTVVHEKDLKWIQPTSLLYFQGQSSYPHWEAKSQQGSNIPKKSHQESFQESRKLLSLQERSCKNDQHFVAEYCNQKAVRILDHRLYMNMKNVARKGNLFTIWCVRILCFSFPCSFSSVQSFQAGKII